eukprot:3664672-Rhodomonas_salina.1
MGNRKEEGENDGKLGQGGRAVRHSLMGGRRCLFLSLSVLFLWCYSGKQKDSARAGHLVGC